MDYRHLKKQLNKYHKFSFTMPRKGKDFTPQQKAAITRQFNKLQTGIKAEYQERATFIKYPKGSRLPHIEGIRTNTGIFYKSPGAKVTTIRERGKKKYVVKVEYKKRRDMFIPFPPHIINDPEQIKEYVLMLVKKYKPKSTHLSVYGYRTKPRYDPQAMNFYQEQLTKFNFEHGKTAPRFDGVFLIF